MKPRVFNCILIVCGSLACSSNVTPFHVARMNGILSSTKLHARNTEKTQLELAEQNKRLEASLQVIRDKVELAESKAFLCETKAEHLLAKPGTYSKIR